MKCALCKKTIRKYDSTLNNLKIDESNSVDICPDCIDKFIGWQGKLYARLFPTNLMKKRFLKK